MRKLIVLSAFLSLVQTSQLFCQDSLLKAHVPKPGKNGWFIEIAGANLLGVSANYERFLSKKPGGFSVRGGIGIGAIGWYFEYSTYIVAPVGASYNIPINKNHKHFLELTSNYSLVFDQHDVQGLLNAGLGWRYESSPRGIILRANLLPLWINTSHGDGGAFPWIGFSVGKKF